MGTIRKYSYYAALAKWNFLQIIHDTRALDLKAIEEAFTERGLAQLHKRELISDDDVAQILSQDHLRLTIRRCLKGS
jgi:hypothetical protein